MALTDENIDTLYGINNLVNCTIPSVLALNGTVICETQVLNSLYNPDDSLIVNNANVVGTPVAPYPQIPVTAEDSATYESAPPTAVCPCKTDWANFFGNTVNKFPPTLCGTINAGPRLTGYFWGAENWAAIVDPQGVGYTCQLKDLNTSTFVNKGGSGTNGKLSADEVISCSEEALKYCTPPP